MKVPSLLLSGLCLFQFSFSSLAQDFEVPANVKFDKRDDYTKYEADVIKAAKWLEYTQIGKEMDKRKKVNAFVVQWITGSPTVSIEIKADFVTRLSGKNGEFTIMFMAGYVRYSLENNYSTDELKGYTAAVKSIINLYNMGGDVKKDKFVQMAVDADMEGRLEEWVKDNKDKK